MSFPRRSAPDFGGFGGMFSRPPPATLAIMVATFGLSVLAMGSGGAFGDGTFFRLLVFSPALVLERFQVWSLVTYLFIELQPLQLILHIVFPLWLFASQLERQWGTRRFLFYFGATGVGGALITFALSFVAPSLQTNLFFGTSVVAGTAILAWVLMNWHATVYLLFFPVRAPYLLILVLGIPALYIIQGHWQPFVPVLAALAIGYLLLQRRGLSIRRGYLHFRAWWIDRQLRRKARHLRVVPPPDKDRDEKPTRYLH